MKDLLVQFARYDEGGNFSSASSSSQGIGQTINPVGGGEGADLVTTTIPNIINIIIGVLAIVAVVVMIIGGITYMTSSGDAGKVKKAKDTILYGVIGLVVCALAYAIVNWVIGGLLAGQLVSIKIARRGGFLLDYQLGEEGSGDEASFFAFGFVGVVEDTDGPVDYRKGEGADDETDTGIKDGVFGFFELAGVALGGHVVYATDDDEDNGYDTQDGDDGIQNRLDDGNDGVGVAIATGGTFNFGGGG